MDKLDFLTILRAALSSLPQTEIEERVNFYSEMIDDYVEEGLTEEEAVARIGSPRQIAAQIVADCSPANAESRANRHNPWKIAAIVLGLPIWLSLHISAISVVFSVYVSLWAVIVSLWSAFGALVCYAFSGILSGTVFAATGYVIPGVAMVGTALICGGLSIFMFYGCKAATNGAVLLTKKLSIAIQNCRKKKEAVQNA